MQKPLTQNRLKNIALSYLERFDASSCKMRQVLKRRVQRQKVNGFAPDPQTPQWIESVIQELQRLNYINDERYIENTVRRLSESGKSTQFIRQKLRTEGLDTTLIDSFLTPQNDLENARQFAHKKHLGANYQKDLAKLARAGFDYETAKTVLEEIGSPNLSDETDSF